MNDSVSVNTRPLSASFLSMVSCWLEYLECVMIPRHPLSSFLFVLVLLFLVFFYIKGFVLYDTGVRAASLVQGIRKVESGPAHGETEHIHIHLVVLSAHFNPSL